MIFRIQIHPFLWKKKQLMNIRNIINISGYDNDNIYDLNIKTIRFDF